MNVAYFSTTRATGSSNSYSRFTCCGGLLMIDMCFLLFSSFSCFTGRGQNTAQTEPFPVCGAGATPRSVGQPKAAKSGVAPAHPYGLPASNLNVAPCATSMLPITSRHPRGDANRDAKSDLCLSCTRHRAQKPQRAENCDRSKGKCRKTRHGPA